MFRLKLIFHHLCWRCLLKEKNKNLRLREHPLLWVMLPSDRSSVFIFLFHVFITCEINPLQPPPLKRAKVYEVENYPTPCRANISLMRRQNVTDVWGDAFSGRRFVPVAWETGSEWNETRCMSNLTAGKWRRLLYGWLKKFTVMNAHAQLFGLLLYLSLFDPRRSESL